MGGRMGVWEGYVGVYFEIGLWLCENYGILLGW